MQGTHHNTFDDAVDVKDIADLLRINIWRINDYLWKQIDYEKARQKNDWKLKVRLFWN